LRDIHAKRLKWSPLSPADLRTLVDMGCVEVVGGELVITLTGMDEKDLRLSKLLNPSRLMIPGRVFVGRR